MPSKLQTRLPAPLQVTLMEGPPLRRCTVCSVRNSGTSASEGPRATASHKAGPPYRSPALSPRSKCPRFFIAKDLAMPVESAATGSAAAQNVEQARAVARRR